MGCSTTKFKKRNLEAGSLDLLKSGLSKVCLSGEGRGRFYSADERKTFSFESLLDTGKKKLDISYHFPFHGEEGLSIFYKEALKEQITYQGSLFERIKKEVRKDGGENLRGFFSPYVTKLGQFLFLFNSFKNTDYFDDFVRCHKEPRQKGLIKGECSYGSMNRSFIWETSLDHFSFRYDLPSQKGSLRLIFDREKENFFSKWTISFYASSQEAMPLKIEKYITSCES